MRRGLALGLISALLVTAGCTTPTPPPATPSPSPTASRPETQIEREQRVAYEAAEVAYRTSLRDLNSMLARGGSNTVPAAFKKVATGPYLDDIEFFLKDFKSTGDVSSGQSIITGFTRNGFEPAEVILTACVDGRPFVVRNKSGKVIQRGKIDFYDLTARNEAGQWKIYSVVPSKANAC